MRPLTNKILRAAEQCGWSPFTQPRHGATIQPGDTGSGGPMFSGDDDELFGPVIDPPAPAPPPGNIADSTAVPSADFQAQVETGTGHGGEVPPPEPGGPGGGEGMFNPRSRSTLRRPALAAHPCLQHVDIGDADRNPALPQPADSVAELQKSYGVAQASAQSKAREVR
jgi:hypothetical protein